MNSRNDTYLCPYACCIPVKGYQRGIIYDIQRANYYIVPLSLLDIMEKGKHHTYNMLSTHYSEEEKEILDEYYSFLINNELCFLCEKTDILQYPPLNLEYDVPFPITNAIIEFNQMNKDQWNMMLPQLEKVRCPHILLFFSTEITESDIEFILESSSCSTIKTIEWIVPYHEKTEDEQYKKLIKKYPRFIKIIHYGSPDNKYIRYMKSTIAYSSEPISILDCGKINSNYFPISMAFFTESQKFNTCLNRKITIDTEGNIKNCPAMSETYGNINIESIESVIQKKEFQTYWTIHKDQIEVCKDCEFRYMCSDCRCYLKRPETIFSQPLKCTYNPYIAQWEGEEGYIPVEACGSYNKEAGFVPDFKKIERIITQLSKE